MDAEGTRAELPRVGELPFDGATKYMATLRTRPDGRTRVHVKGAADVLLHGTPSTFTPAALSGPTPVSIAGIADPHGVQVAAVQLPWVGTVFGTVPLTVAQWALSLGPRPPCCSPITPCAPYGRRPATTVVTPWHAELSI